MLTKVDRQVSQFKVRMLKGKVGGGGEVRTQRLVYDNIRKTLILSIHAHRVLNLSASHQGKDFDEPVLVGRLYVQVLPPPMFGIL